MADKKVGGRGAKLFGHLRKLEAQAGIQEPESASSSQVGVPLVEEKPHEEPAFKPSRGRGAILAKALSRGRVGDTETDTDSASAVSQPSSVGVSSGAGDGASKPSGGGRGSFLQQLKAQRASAASLIASTNAAAETAKVLGPAALGGRGSQIGLGASTASVASGSVRSHKTDPHPGSLEDQIRNISLEEEDEGPVIKKGEKGDPIKVTCNYVTLFTDPGKGVFEYEVRFKPAVDNTRYRFQLINEHFKTRRGIRTYDGGDKLYMPEMVTDSKLVIESKHPNDDSAVTIFVIFKRKMRLGECVHLYNVLFNNCLKTQQYSRLGRQYYNHREAHSIPQHKLEVWPGYVTSVAEFEGGVHLCCDIAHRVLRTETPLDVLTEMARYDRNNYKDAATKALLGQCVLTRYNNNLYRIDDIDWEKSPLSTFTLSNGEKMSFVDYYKKQYDLRINDHHQPLLVNKAKKHKKDENPNMICLIPELCYLTGLTDKMRSDFKVMKDIATYTRVTPAQRNLGFKKFLKNLKENEHAVQMLKEWGLTLPDDPITLDARTLPPENIIFGRNQRVQGQKSADWMKYARSSYAIRSVDIKNWILIYYYKDNRRATNFASTIKKVGPGMGIQIYDPTEVSLKDDRIEAWIRGLKDNLRDTTQIVVLIVPTQRDDRYAAIKKLCCREIPIPSQVVLSNTISKEDKMRPIIQNIALQMNNKLGGAGWTVDVPLRTSMVCGIDTYHDRDKKGKSVGAFVASLDPQFTTWFSRTCIQDPRQELIDGLVQCFVAALKKYLMLNHILPEKIFIFRDGVGDGQIKICREYEVVQFLEACRLVSPDYQPSFSFILVQKRINTRYFMHTDPYGRNLENPAPGSVLDHTVTRRNYYDFFLVSQQVRQGTASPSHYIVIYDTSGLKVDNMQRLAYKFCHLYYNWPGTIRVPAPCQYAHKLAYLVGQCVKGMPDERLEDKLYYL